MQYECKYFYLIDQLDADDVGLAAELAVVVAEDEAELGLSIHGKHSEQINLLWEQSLDGICTCVTSIYVYISVTLNTHCIHGKGCMRALI